MSFVDAHHINLGQYFIGIFVSDINAILKNNHSRTYYLTLSFLYLIKIYPMCNRPRYHEYIINVIKTIKTSEVYKNRVVRYMWHEMGKK